MKRITSVSGCFSYAPVCAVVPSDSLLPEARDSAPGRGPASGPPAQPQGAGGRRRQGRPRAGRNGRAPGVCGPRSSGSLVGVARPSGTELVRDAERPRRAIPAPVLRRGAAPAGGGDPRGDRRRRGGSLGRGRCVAEGAGRLGLAGEDPGTPRVREVQEGAAGQLRRRARRAEGERAGRLPPLLGRRSTSRSGPGPSSAATTAPTRSRVRSSPSFESPRAAASARARRC